MRPFLLLSLLLLSRAQAQFAPDGAEWVYDQPGSPGYTVSVVGDTLIDGHPCKILQGSSESPCWEWRAFVYQDADRVYFLNAAMDDFTLLYNWGAQVNDTWDVVLPPTSLNVTLTYTVLSTSTVTLSGQVRRLLQVKLHDDLGDLFGFSSGILIEGLGDVLYVFPWYMPWCDAMFPGPLRCYSDPLFQWSNPATMGCAAAIGMPQTEAAPGPVVAPSLAGTGEPIRVSGLEPTDELLVVDAVGKLVHRVRPTADVVTLSLDRSGAYTLLLLRDDRPAVRERIVVH